MWGPWSNGPGQLMWGPWFNACGVGHTTPTKSQAKNHIQSSIMKPLDSDPLILFKNLNKERTQVESFCCLDYQIPTHQNDSTSLVRAKRGSKQIRLEKRNTFCYFYLVLEKLVLDKNHYFGKGGGIIV